MKALLLKQAGSLDNLYVGEAALPTPKKDQVRIKVQAAGLNPVDYKLAQSGNSAWQYPFILGLDVAGIIDAVGENVTDWKIGDAVYYHGNLSKPGGFAEYTIATTKALAFLPQGVSFTEAAALPCAGFTAYQALMRKLHIQPRQTILIQGGAGGVGGFGIQIAAITGLEVITTCSASNKDYVQELGAHHVIDYRSEDVAAAVKDITKRRGVDAILDTVSADSATAGLEMLAFNGAIACIAGLPDFQKIEAFKKAPSVHAIALGGAYLAEDENSIKDLGRMASELGELVSKKKVNPLLTEVVSLAEIPQALARLKERHVRGKIAAKISA